MGILPLVGSGVLSSLITSRALTSRTKAELQVTSQMIAKRRKAIDQRHHQKIFEPFHSFFSQEGEEEGKERKGLGLAIVRKIVQAHGGEIWVESKPGQGASFHFTLRKN